MTATVHARWGHRVDDLIHTHAWAVSATVGGPIDCDKVFPADDLERMLADAVAPWSDRYLTDTDVGEWKGYRPLVWDREPTVEEIARRLWAILEPKVPDLCEIALEEASEFDRCRVVRLTK
jgi:6-pyruvoyl-tetrahydropterin synthase